MTQDPDNNSNIRILDNGLLYWCKFMAQSVVIGDKLKNQILFPLLLMKTKLNFQLLFNVYHA